MYFDVLYELRPSPILVSTLVSLLSSTVVALARVDQDFSCPITRLGYPFRLYIRTAQSFLANPYLSQFPNHVLQFRSSNLDPQIHVINQLHQSNHVLFPPLNPCYPSDLTELTIESLC
ncbi:hypothetical protein L1987_75617 [Smallanthus sonchifolius]|uniref:Uncharacterized protein n=1 Tax=Smallanthus sonchifolius TaxID=185202 RepID=A0ACB9A619_9ASTR|nr:hypothetical protein L1987_75617 [Smallanthus sonchifolius]